MLGFKSRLDRDGLATVAAGYRDLRRQALFANQIPVIGPGVNQVWTTRLAIASDTLMVWSDDDPEAVDSFLTTCGFLIGYAFNIGWPLRGGIAYGECVMNAVDSEFLGQPIIDAMVLEKRQEWIGAGLDRSCARANSFRTVESSDSLVRYPIPLKRPNVFQQIGMSVRRKKEVPPLDLAVNWPLCCDVDRRGKLADLLVRQEKKHREKYRNALAFVDFVEAL